MTTYAIGDIHGCLRSLEALLKCIPLRPGDRIVFLGDYVDRGENSKGVIERILELGKTCKLVALRGNHEVMMLEAGRHPREARLWLSCGGRETLLSYGAEGAHDWAKRVPSSHWDFLRGTQRYFETTDWIFVHGKVDAALEMDEQDPYTLIWDKCHDMAPHRSGKQVICGHTPQPGGKPGVYDFGVCIDTEAWDEGWLTCLDPASGKYWQANESGRTREGSVWNHAQD